MPSAATPDLTPGAFLGLVGHPLRWRLLAELGYSDRQVHELAAAADQPQNLVSYHLGRLRNAGLVSMRRSRADRRDAYYCADLVALRDLFAAVGDELHPGLRLLSSPVPRQRPAVRVLFLCTGNSSRSQMAEALLRATYGATVEVASAGSHPKTVHPHAIAAMAAAGHDISTARTKHLDLFAGQPFDWVVTLCDRVREICPEFPAARRVHWNVPDPSAEADGYPAFERILSDVDVRVQFLVHRLAAHATTTGTGAP